MAEKDIFLLTTVDSIKLNHESVKSLLKKKKELQNQYAAYCVEKCEKGWLQGTRDGYNLLTGGGVKTMESHLWRDSELDRLKGLPFKRAREKYISRPISRLQSFFFKAMKDVSFSFFSIGDGIYVAGLSMEDPVFQLSKCASTLYDKQKSPVGINSSMDTSIESVTSEEEGGTIHILSHVFPVSCSCPHQIFITQYHHISYILC
jgi:hypothetical protein